MFNRFKNVNKKLLIVLSIALMATCFLFSYYESFERHHECDHGEECPICQVLQVCKSVKKGTQVSGNVKVLLALIVCLHYIIKNDIEYKIENTLIDMKVRLDD